MSREQQVQQHLHAVKKVMQIHGLWQHQPPLLAAFDSMAPFCIDTMQPLEWLQWVLIPRLQALLDSASPLPENFSLSPYYETALAADVSGRLSLLKQITLLDKQFRNRSD